MWHMIQAINRAFGWNAGKSCDKAALFTVAFLWLLVLEIIEQSS